MLKRSSSLPQEFPRSQGWPLSRFLHTSSEREEFSTYRAAPPLSIQAWKPLTSVDPEPRRVRGAVPSGASFAPRMALRGAAEEANPPNSLPLNGIPSLPAADRRSASSASRMGLRDEEPAFRRWGVGALVHPACARRGSFVFSA